MSIFNWGKKKVNKIPEIDFGKGKFLSTKTYGNDRGFSCCFRQWKAKHSHCSLLHGYSLGFKLVFECDRLDERNWVMDFGGLKELKDWLEDHFDPEIGQLRALEKRGLAKIKVFDNVGSEKFAEEVFKQMTIIIERSKYQKKALNPTVRVKSVEVFEHDANSAIYERA
jgi:6-pyruvoyltetrahydropterin/6-carboxytetrahydropterin synthase